MSQSIASQDTTAAEQIPTKTGNTPPALGSEKASFNSTNPAIVMAGIPNKNEKRAASARFQPSKSDAVSVLPERETPGIKASTCAKPTTSQSRPST